MFCKSRSNWSQTAWIAAWRAATGEVESVHPVERPHQALERLPSTVRVPFAIQPPQKLFNLTARACWNLVDQTNYRSAQLCRPDPDGSSACYSRALQWLGTVEHIVESAFRARAQTNPLQHEHKTPMLGFGWRKRQAQRGITSESLNQPYPRVAISLSPSEQTANAVAGTRGDESEFWASCQTR